MNKQALTNEILLSLFETLKRKCNELQDTDIIIEEGKRGNTYSFKRNNGHQILPELKMTKGELYFFIQGYSIKEHIGFDKTLYS